MRHLPLSLTLLRLGLAPLVVVLSGGPHPILFGLILAAAFLSDIFDGVLARRLGVATPFLRRLDSAVDIVFYLGVGWALWRQRPEAVRPHLALLAALIGLELLHFLVARLKYGRKASYHLWSAKAWASPFSRALWPCSPSTVAPPGSRSCSGPASSRTWKGSR